MTGPDVVKMADAYTSTTTVEFNLLSVTVATHYLLRQTCDKNWRNVANFSIFLGI